MPICPSCNGRGQTFAFVDYADRTGETRFVECSDCKGAGEVTEGFLMDQATGRKLRTWRVHTLHESHRDVALRFGLTVVELSQMEHGRLPIPAALWEAAGLGEKADET